MLTNLNSRGVGMNQCAATHGGDAVTWLWSGGAADCIIVAAYANRRAYITHVDRLTEEGDWLSSLFRAMGGNPPRIYLSSSAFVNDPGGGMVTGVRSALQRNSTKFTLSTELNHTSFAICAAGGATLAAVVTGHLNPPPPRGMGFGEVYWSLPTVRRVFVTQSLGGSKESPY